MTNPQPFGWVVNSPEDLEPVEAFVRDKQSADMYLASGWTVTPVVTLGAVDGLKVELNEAYNSLLEHVNESERYLDEAAELLAEVAKSGEAYRECTDSSSPTGKRIAAVVEYVSQFLPEPVSSLDIAAQDDWRMNPCRQGHRDVGASGGKAECNQCGEQITASTTQEAFERWNASHPALPV